MENRKLYWIVLSGVALTLLAMSLRPGVRHAGAHDPEAKKLHLKIVSTNTDYEELKVHPSP